MLLSIETEVCFVLQSGSVGSVSEWFKEHAWKACVRATVPEVRILSLPPGYERVAETRSVSKDRRN